MFKLFSRIALTITALSAVFFTSSAFASTPFSSSPYFGYSYNTTDAKSLCGASYPKNVRWVQWISYSGGIYSMNSAVKIGTCNVDSYSQAYSGTILSFCPSLWDTKMTSYWDSGHATIINAVAGYISPGLVNYSVSWSVLSSSWFQKSPTYFYLDWTSPDYLPYTLNPPSTGLSATCWTTWYIWRKWEWFMSTSVLDYPSVASGSYNTYTGQYCFSDGTCFALTNLASSTCSVDNIASGGNCSCKKTGWYSPSASWSTSMIWKYNGADVGWSITNSTTSDLFSAKFNRYYITLPSWSTYKPDRTLGTIDVSDIGGTRWIQVFGTSTGMIYTDSRTLVSTASGNSYTFNTSDGWLLSGMPVVSNVSTNPAGNYDNTFNSFVINSSTWNTLLLLTNKFQVYYQRWAGLDYSNVADNYTYLGSFASNTMITLPYWEKTRRIRIVPLTTTAYVSWISLFNTPFTDDQVCTNLYWSDLTAELASRSSLSGSTNVENINFCSSALDVPVVGSALSAMCNFVQPYVKPLVAKFQPAVDMINIMPPLTAPTTFDYYPKFSFSGMTMSISTQTGSIPTYSTWSDVNPLQITSDTWSSNLKIGFFALVSILLYLVVYALHIWIVVGLVWILLHVSRYFTGFVWKHNSSGNIWTLAPFLVYAGVFFTALVSIIASVSFILPLLQVVRAYALFLITFMTSFAPWSYALFSWFYAVVFSSIFLIFAFYLIYFLFERFSKLN